VGERALRVVVGLLACLSVTAALAEDARPRRYPMPGHGSLGLTLPVSWRDELRQPPSRLPPTIVFKPATGAPFQVFVTPIWPPRDAPPSTAEDLRRSVERAAEQAKARAVEQTLEVKELRGSSGSGYYFSATDRAPGPGEYKYLTQGMIRVGGLVVTFTILTNDGQASVAADALAMVGGALHGSD